MIANWKRKFRINKQQKKDPVLKEVEVKVNTPDDRNERKMIDDLLRATNDCKMDINSLRSTVLQMSKVLAALDKVHLDTEIGIHQLREEIETNLNEKTRTINEKRNIEARIVCLRNLMTIEKTHHQMVKLNNFQLVADIQKLENKIKGMKKINRKMSSSKNKSSRFDV